jgi:hypothetical protein
MSYSLNEVEVTAKRAARGAGFSWGLAEEAGKATRWLCANSLDGCAVLARFLDQIADQPITDVSPVSLDGEWASTSGRLCPLMAGVTLSDAATRLDNGEIVMTGVMYPALLLPFVAGAAQQRKGEVTVTWDGLTVTTDNSDMSLVDAAKAFTAPAVVQLRVEAGGSVDRPLPHATRATPDAAHWATLNRFAHRTYAPASEASRVLGAGAGLSDND